VKADREAERERRISSRSSRARAPRDGLGAELVLRLESSDRQAQAAHALRRSSV
jgi:hypothetical protein